MFDPGVVTAAHKTLPMPSVVRVTNLDNGKSLVVRVNDRGPFSPGRIIEFPTLTSTDQGAMPEMVAAIKPTVNLTAKSSKIKPKVVVENPPSALELLSQSRVGKLISVAPVITKIWIQVGAFHAQASAMTVLSRIRGVGLGEVSMVNHRGKILYRVRLGPLFDVAKADAVLEKVVNIGFTGARIIVD